MKNTLFFLLLSVVVFACKKDEKSVPYEEPELTVHWGAASATVNGEGHNLEAAVSNSIKDPNWFSMAIYYFFDKPNHLYCIAVHSLPMAVGTYYPPDSRRYNNPRVFSHSFGWSIGGDSPGGAYKPMSDSSFVLHIDELNMQTGDIAGRFSGAYIKTDDYSPDSTYYVPDTVRIEDGKFRTKLSRW
jgi:hypothetical protein